MVWDTPATVTVLESDVRLVPIAFRAVILTEYVTLFFTPVIEHEVALPPPEHVKLVCPFADAVTV